MNNVGKFASHMLSWPPSPSTVIGAATIVGFLSSAISKQIPWASAIPGISGGVIAILLPDNANAVTAAKKLAADALTANAMGNAPVLVTDAEALEKAVQDATPPLKPPAAP